MEPASFKESNTYLGPPPGISSDEVQALSIWRGQQGEDGPIIVVSCWIPTKEELEEINRTGRIWLGIHGVTMPPAWVSGTNPFKQERTNEPTDQNPD